MGAPEPLRPYGSALLAGVAPLTCLALGQASCGTALAVFFLSLAAVTWLARVLVARPVGRPWWLQLACFLCGGSALLASFLLALPAPHWLGTSTPGRHGLLGLLAVLAVAGVGGTIATARGAPCTAPGAPSEAEVTAPPGEAVG